MNSILIHSSKNPIKNLARITRCLSTRSTEDKEQIELFNQIGGKWWNDPQLKSLQNMNKVRIPLIKQYVAPMHGNCHYANTHNALKGIKMLDVGCGGGFLSEGLAKFGADITGLEPAQDLITAAKEHATLDPSLADNLKYESISVEEWNKKHPEYYDVVVSSEVIEHVNEPEYFLGNCLACLRPGGSIILTTMSQNWLGGFVNIFLAENLTKIIPKGAHEYSKFIHPQKMQEMLAAHKCSTIAVKGFWINTITAESHLMPVTWFNYALHAVKHK